MNCAPSCAIIGGGPSGLFAAEHMAQAGFTVTIYDQMPSLGRKFLMAGVGGLNLTHSEPVSDFLTRYRPQSEWLRRALSSFGPVDLRDWCNDLGEPTFVGSSGRVFPKSMKASPLLRAWLYRLGELGVVVKTRHCWIGWSGKALQFTTPNGDVDVDADITVLALGGASWPRLGSDGRWVETLKKSRIPVGRLRPSNCGFQVNWSDHFSERFAGNPLKSIRTRCGDVEASGEAMITKTGIEGGAVYALSPILRDRIDEEGSVDLHVDLKPGLDRSTIERRLAAARSGDSFKNKLRKSLRLLPPAIALLREATGQVPSDPGAVAGLVKSLPVTLSGVAPIERAISTAGGLSPTVFDDNMMLHEREGVFVAGEMLDWEAPTGGYLLQACFALGKAAADCAIVWHSANRL